MNTDDSEQLRSAFERSREAMLIVDTHGCVMAANPAANTLFDAGAIHPLEGMQIEALIHEQRRAPSRPQGRARTYRPVLAQHLALQGQRRDGETFPAEVSLVPLDGEWILVTVHDITDRQRVERALARNLADIECLRGQCHAGPTAQRPSATPPHAARLARLSAREREVLRLAVAGRSNKEIARELGISHRTVETHRSHILRKTASAGLLDLARLAQESGLTPRLGGQ